MMLLRKARCHHEIQDRIAGTRNEGSPSGDIGLPGCWSQGNATEAEALENIADAIRECLDAGEMPKEEGWLEREVEIA